jgi:hypothetical protein
MGDATVTRAGQMSRSIVLDYDGTVTESDLLDRVAKEFGDPAVYQEVEDGLDEGRLSLREVITREFLPVTAPLEEVVAWVLEHARVRPGFAEFVSSARNDGWDVHIVSSGFHELIEPVLDGKESSSPSTPTASIHARRAGSSSGITRTTATSAESRASGRSYRQVRSSTWATGTRIAALHWPRVACSQPQAWPATWRAEVSRSSSSTISGRSRTSCAMGRPDGQPVPVSARTASA